MTKIITICNEKGGTGKTTVATNLATALHRAGKQVVLVDADPQGSARDWRDASPEGANLPPVVAIDRPQLLISSLQTLAAYEYIIIDGPAKAEAMAAACVRVAHVALVVIQPSGVDLWASAATVKLIRSKIDIGGQINAAFVVNRTSGATKLSKLVLEGEWNDYGIDQMDSTIGNRVAFAQALTDGISVYDLQDSQAKKEIDLLIVELEKAKWL
jgi:chromosome partitioning protein